MAEVVSLFQVARIGGYAEEIIKALIFHLEWNYWSSLKKAERPERCFNTWAYLLYSKPRQQSCTSL